MIRVENLSFGFPAKDLYEDAIQGTLKLSTTDGWEIGGNTTNTAATSSSAATTITLTYHNSALNNSTHTLSYTITLKNNKNSADTTASDAVLSGPTEGYKQISNS